MLRSYQNQTVKFLAVLLIGLYIVSPFSILAHLSSMANMNMSGMNMNEQINCVHISNTNSLCPVNANDHLSIWKNVILSASPSVKIFIIALSLVFALGINIPSYRINKLYQYLKRQKYKKRFNLYTLLFSKGILNTKEF